MTKLSVITLLVSMAAGVASCSKNATSGTIVKDSTATGAKKPISGLVTQGSADSEDSAWVPDNTFPEANAHPNIYTAVVIRVEWKQLEPQPGQFDFSAIDSALNNVKKYNLLYPNNPITAKLRVFCGVNVPAWVKTMAGGPLSAVDPNNGLTIQIGLFWSAPYRQAWEALQTALAARYDANPLLQEVAVSSCSTMTAEPFIQPFNSQTIAILHGAGFTDSAFKAALTGALDDYAPWKLTAVDYTFNPFRSTDSGQPITDSLFAPALMQTFRTTYGSRAVIANHGLQSPASTAQTDFYTPFLSLGKPIEFQTVSPTVDWNATIALGLMYSPSEMEIWDTQAAGGSANISTTQLQTWASEIGN